MGLGLQTKLFKHLEDCKDFIRVYALEEIGAEKVLALTDRARNEPRDLYDIWYLISEKHVDLAELVPEIESKLQFRRRDRAGMHEEFDRKEARYERLWDARLGAQMAVLPEFGEVFRLVRRAMRTAGLLD